MYSIREFENFCQEKYYSLCNEYPVMFDVDDEIGTFVSFKYENSFLRDIDSIVFKRIEENRAKNGTDKKL